MTNKVIKPTLLSLVILLVLAITLTFPAIAEQPTTITTLAPEAEPTSPAENQPLYLSIFWHQHQPLYFKESKTGVYQKPWVRLHAAKDYVDMAAILEEYPEIQATFNLTPSLLRQLIDLENGAIDLYQLHTEIPAAELSQEEKQFIKERFFDINPKIIARFPRYQQLVNDRENSDTWDEQRWLDLQILFNLGWTDPDFLTEEPLAGLVEKEQDFDEADKTVILTEHARLVAEVIPLHKRLQDEGRIQLTMTPFFHPILPLLVDSNLAREAVHDIELPARFVYGLDAVRQVEMGVEFYEEQFGQPPTGMWPAEGAVAQSIVSMVAKAGISWMASDEEVLARSLGMKGFTRNAQETVQEPELLYRPYIAKGGRSGEVYIVFRDKTISDKVGFTYSGQDGLRAAQDMVDRLLAIRDSLAEDGKLGEPFLVSVILDGENAWEHYENDGKKFLHNMYRLLEAEQKKGTIQTVTPSQFIEQFPEQPALEELWAGSWVSPDYLTWIGEEEENRAWNYLQQVRRFVQQEQRKLDEETRAAVLDAIYTAEGSDWFWWYGSDQNSGNDESFDLQFRLTLQRVYELMGKPIPAFLKVPVIPAIAQEPTAGLSALIVPEIDGMADDGEWDEAGYYLEEGGVQATAEQLVERLWYGFDSEHLFLRLDGRRPWQDMGEETRIGFYLTRPGSQVEQPFTRLSLLQQAEKEANGAVEETLLGFGANGLVELLVNEDGIETTRYTVNGKGAFIATDIPMQAAVDGTTIELALPYADFGKPDSGGVFKLRTVISEGERRDIQVVPTGGPAQLLVPDLGLTQPILTVIDPAGDDYGPGSYTYPQDGVFNARTYDLTEFAVAEDENSYIFRFTFAGKLNNSWGAPNGMGIHALDIYIDIDPGEASGMRKLLPGRNAALPESDGWELAIWAEGWTPGVYGKADVEGKAPQELGGAELLNIVSDAGNNKITIRMSKVQVADALGVALADLNPQSWGFLGIVSGQEGFPSSGIWRLRDVESRAKQWRFGGAPNDTNHTRIMDVAYSSEFSVTQEDTLGNYPPSQVGDMDELTADDFAQLPLVVPEKVGLKK